VPVTTLHKILRKRIYTGEFEYGGVTYHGSHEPLVEREVWERVQEILDGRHEKKHRKVRHDFPFSGLVSCGHYGCSLVGEMKKQRYVYCHCTGYRGKCPEPYTREETLEAQFAGRLRHLVVPPAVLTWLQEELVASDCTERTAREQELRRQQRELERPQARLDVLNDDRRDGRIDAAIYDKRAKEVRDQQQRIRQRVSEAQGLVLTLATEALDLMAVTSKASYSSPRPNSGACCTWCCEKRPGKPGSCGCRSESPLSNFDFRTPQVTRKAGTSTATTGF